MIHTSEQEYLDLLKRIMKNGVIQPNRTGTDTLKIIGAQCRYNLQEGFPLFTTKRVWLKGIIHELLWLLKGDTNIKYLVDNGVNIWNDDAYRYYRERYIEESSLEIPLRKDAFMEHVISGDLRQEDRVIGNYSYGDLGPVYGAQWRAWQAPASHQSYVDEWIAVDQISNLVDGLKNNPTSRRHILSAWNVAEIDRMALPPCHVMSMFSVLEGKLHCQMIQRSGDMILGVPFNVASYALLTHMLAQICGYEVGSLIHTLHDSHIYVNHLDAAREQLGREPRPLPKLVLNPEVKDIFDFKYEDIRVQAYNPHPTIKADLVT